VSVRHSSGTTTLKHHFKDDAVLQAGTLLPISNVGFYTPGIEPIPFGGVDPRAGAKRCLPKNRVMGSFQCFYFEHNYHLMVMNDVSLKQLGPLRPGNTRPPRSGTGRRFMNSALQTLLYSVHLQCAQLHISSIFIQMSVLIMTDASKLYLLGHLTLLRATMVNGQTQSVVATDLGMPQYVISGEHGDYKFHSIFCSLNWSFFFV